MRIHRLSHHTLELLHTCERKYQIDRLLTNKEAERELNPYPATKFGSAFGAAVADFFVHQNLERAIYKLWLEYFPKVEDERRSEVVCINMMQAAVPIIETVLQDWEVVYFQGKPAVELSFRINIDSTYYYVGYIDLCLRNRFTGRYAVFDVKTTALNLLNLSPIYQNSGQALSYSVGIDAIVGKDYSEYNVFYFVGQIGSGNGFQPVIKPYVFDKTLQDRLHWFISLKLDVDHIKNLARINFYPRRGDNCLQYNKPCPHFGTCHLHDMDREEAKTPEEEKTYQFTFELDEIIKDHIARIGAR